MDVDKLITNVFIRAALWDQKDKNHHNRFVLDKEWDQVAKQLNTTRIVARNKWKSLRDKFRVTLATIPKPKSGDPAPAKYSGQWKYFQSLLFLRDQFTPRIHGGNFEAYDEDETNVSPVQNFQEDDSLDFQDSRQSESPEPPELLEVHTPRSASSQCSSSAVESHANVTIIRKKRTNTDIGPALLDIENRKIKYLEDKRKQAPVEEDEDLAFFKSLLPHVKTLSAFDKMTYRVQVIQVTQSFLNQQATHSTAPPCSQQVSQHTILQNPMQSTQQIPNLIRNVNIKPAINANKTANETLTATAYYNNCQDELDNDNASDIYAAVGKYHPEKGNEIGP